MNIKSNTKHTPTPWTPEIINNWPESQEKENQEFMLRAVNSHEALLEALKRFLTFNGRYGNGEQMDALDYSMNLADLHKQAREAIALTEEKEI